MRRVFKDRIEVFSHIVNKSAHEAKNFQEFVWMVEDRLSDASLPKVYKDLGKDKKMLGQFWQDFQDLGYCVQADELRKLEKA